MCSNIPAKPTYGVYVSQLIRISRICDNYVSFVKRHRLLTEILIKQGFWYNKLSISFKKFSRRHSMLFNKYAVSVKRHIREGICIPLDVKPDLVRNITTRNHGCGQYAVYKLWLLWCVMMIWCAGLTAMDFAYRMHRTLRHG